VSVKTIRFYSDAGLLPPRRSSAGHRQYDSTDLARLALIRNLRSLDVGLDMIGELLTGVTDLHQCLIAQEQALQQLRLLPCAANSRCAGPQPTTTPNVTPAIAGAQQDRSSRTGPSVGLVLGHRPPQSQGSDQMRRSGTPDLPPEPTAAQVDAWLELTELAADPDFRDTLRRNANWFSQHTTRGFDQASWPHWLAHVFTLAEPLIGSLWSGASSWPAVLGGRR